MVPNQSASGQYFVVIAFQDTPGETYSMRTCALSPVGSPIFSALTLVLPVDTSVGVYLAFPHVGYFGGLYRLSYVVGDFGTSSGVVYSRCARSVSADFQHWTAPLEDSVTQVGGAAWVRHASGQLLCGAVIRWAPAYNAGENYRDCSSDLVKLDVTEKEGEPARLVATLDNTNGQYTNLGCLVVNAQLQLSQGYVGAG